MERPVVSAVALLVCKLLNYARVAFDTTDYVTRVVLLKYSLLV